MNNKAMEGIFSTVLENIAEVIAGVICEDGIGAIGTEDQCKHYLLKWTSLPYHLPKDLVENVDGYMGSRRANMSAWLNICGSYHRQQSGTTECLLEKSPLFDCRWCWLPTFYSF
jgi:hypothetical protein